MLELIENWFAIVRSFALGKLLPAVILAAIGLLVIYLVREFTKKALHKSKLEKAAHSLILSVVQVVLYALLGLIVASSLGIDVTGIIALASVLTLAVSLAVQNALTNVIGGFTLLYTHPFSSGHYVEIAGQCGTVQEIGLAYTKLSTVDNKIVSIPNSAVVAAEIINYSVGGNRRVDLTINASYDSPVEAVLMALQDAAGEIPTVLPDPAPFAGVRSYGESAIEYNLWVWTKAEDYWTTLFSVNENVKAIFDARGLKMTYPHLNVHMDS